MEFKEKNLINDLFSKKRLSSLSHRNGFDSVKAIFNEKIGINSGSLLEAYDFLYKKLVARYRSEYVYKNAIAEKIVRGKHKFSNIAYYTEFSLENVIADCIVINGNSTVYEIKTEFDNFNRLDSQLNAYRKCFEYIYVVIPESKLSELQKIIPDGIGIILLSSNYTFRNVKKSKLHQDSFDSVAIVDLFRKNELLHIVKKYYQKYPDVQPAYLWSECKNICAELSIEVLNKELKKSLKERNYISDKSLMSKFPSSLLSNVCSQSFNKSINKNILLNLNRELS
ncbi:sce7726 family protein [Celerinatantimonas sp. MCCC 1A17872]|uniref:sce7726 family protein n=1 Tax=Celerinatantimonas sp. MCCC 1A17872 TaxID=3177514 RepID=UPI0038C4E229